MEGSRKDSGRKVSLKEDESYSTHTLDVDTMRIQSNAVCGKLGIQDAMGIQLLIEMSTDDTYDVGSP